MFEIGNKVEFNYGIQKGCGIIVDYNKNYNMYLVNSENIIDGHNGHPVGNKQDNSNNWYFGDQHLKLIEEEQDLRELLKVGYRIKRMAGDTSTIQDKINLKHLKDSRNIKLEYIEFDCNGNDIVAIYRPKYNGIKTVFNPEWELVWKREEPLFTLELPNYKYFDKYYIEYETYDGRFKEYMFGEVESDGWKTTFTQKEIDNLPNQEFIKTLVKKEYKGDK